MRKHALVGLTLGLLLVGCGAAPQSPVGGKDGSLAARSQVSSVVRFDMNRAEVRAWIHELGWNRAGYQVTLLNARTYLHYTTDGWKTSTDVPLQYLRDHQQGFLLRNVAPGTAIEYAVHAHAGRSTNGFRSYDAQAEKWLNSWGQNFKGTTEKNP